MLYDEKNMFQPRDVFMIDESENSPEFKEKKVPFPRKR